jgi:flagellar basal body P-ring formation protein FlgA
MLGKLRVLFISLIIAVTHLTIVGFTATTSEATSRVYLKSEKEISVRTNQVWLSDIFNNIPFESDIVIATTPVLGKKFIFRYRDLKTMILDNELQWRPHTKRVSRSVVRESQELSLKVLRKLIENKLSSHILNYEVEIDFSTPQRRILVPYGSQQAITIDDLSYDDRSSFFRAYIKIDSEISEPMRLLLSGRVHPLVTMPVLKKHIRSGDIIKQNDISWKKVRSKHTSYDLISSTEQLRDQVARRPLIAGRVIRASDVRPQKLVNKGDFVVVQLRNHAMSLSTRGISIESGSRNEIIKIRNPRSKKIIEAKIIAPNLTIIQIPTQSVLN